MSEGDLQRPKQVYRLRVLGLALGFLCVGSVFYDHGASPFAWSLLAAHAFVWPHIAWYRARTNADPPIASNGSISSWTQRSAVCSWP